MKKGYLAWTALPMLLSLTSVPATHISPKPNIGQSVSHDGHDHGAPDRGEVARPKPEKGKALPKVKLAPIEVTSDAQARTLAAPVTNKVGLRALVVAVDGDDFGLATWKAVLDRVGMPYDVVQTRTEALPELLRADGAGKYNAILLTNNSLLYHDGSGFVSGLDAQEWNALWAYERDFAVRQVSLYTAYGSFPEDYCLRPGTENGNATNATLTTQGAPVFDYLKSNVSIPITLSYVYRSALQPGCAAEPILQSGSDVLGVKSTSTDGRERMALTFTSNQYLPQADLLTYGLLRWATRGLMLGERKHYLNVDVDDWFNSTDHLLADGTISPTPFRITQGDASSTLSQQNAFRAANPLASGFKLNIAYNGEGANPNGLVLCLLNLGGEPLSNWSKCNQAQFTWINHTMTHPKMNDTDYTTSLNEINQNLTRAQQMGIPVDRTVLKTGEYSGLGVYHPDPNNDIDPPTDFGLAASNPNLLQAAKDAGVKYLHGNMSFNSHKPSCFNCGIYHPLEQSLLIVPDWPVNVAYHVTNQAEETTFYNSYYGPHGKFPYWPVNQTYTQIVDHESNVGLQHVMSGSVYSHTFHQGNLRNYGGNKNLTFDWINAVVNKYKSYYNVPLVTPNWGGLAGYVAGRNAHFSALTAGADAVYDRTAGTITFTSPANGSVLATNAGGAAYGTDKTATIALTANTPVTVAASPRP